jgi:hypothetical protein
MSRFGRQLQEILTGLERVGAPSALIGGLALAPYHVVRATQDIDLLADFDLADRIDAEFVSLGYRCIYRSNDAATYLRGDQRVDLLYASRPAARRLLGEAVSTSTPFGTLRVVSLEGLIAFKLQGFVNDPRRTQDLEDIRALIRANRAAVKLDKFQITFACSIGRACWMRSLQPPAEYEVPEARAVLLVADGGAPAGTPRDGDPFEALDDLMTVVEALCPEWPPRSGFGPMPEMRL